MAAPTTTEGAAVEATKNVSLYVGDLDRSVNETQLYDVFNQIAQVVSIRVCRDHTRRHSLGYAYVNFNDPHDAAKAMNAMNFAAINGKPIRIMYVNRDPSVRKSGHGNVFIKNLDSSIDNKALFDTFSAFGYILSCKVVFDANGQSKGYGFVQFEHEEAAQNAINKLNGMLLNDKQVFVGAFLRRQDKAQANAVVKFTNVYVKNLTESTTEEDLKKIFGEYGTITSAVIMRDQNGKPKCFGFVNFESPDDAAVAVEKLNGKVLEGDRVLYAGRAQRKSEREVELRARFEQEKQKRYEQLQGANLYLKNLDDSIDDTKLKDMFSKFGTVTSSKVMVDLNGLSRGCGFVAFSRPEEASRALTEMNGKLIGRKPLYVSFFQRKEERKAQLQAFFAQIRASSPVPPPLPSSIPGYHTDVPSLGPRPLYVGQGGPGFIPPQPAGFGFQQQLLHGMRPSVGPYFMMPYLSLRHGPPAQCMGLRHGENPQHMQQPQQIYKRNYGRGIKLMGNGRNGAHTSLARPDILGAPMSPPLDAPPAMRVAQTAIQQKGPRSLSELTSALASASPGDRRTMLGEELYPLVEFLEPGHAAKVTGMLLEMDQTEVLHLIASPLALKEKVAEAMLVLRQSTAAASNIEDELDSAAAT